MKKINKKPKAIQNLQEFSTPPPPSIMKQTLIVDATHLLNKIDCHLFISYITLIVVSCTFTPKNILQS